MGRTRSRSRHERGNARIMGEAGARQLLNSLPNAEAAGPGRSQQPPPPTIHVSGRPLVELFSMRTNIPDVGTIAVFDGTCGQIVYKNDQGQGHAPTSSNCEDFADLALTGPYRAISGDGGSIAVKVDLPGSEKSRDVDGAMLWECDVVDDTNSMIESNIVTNNGNIVVTCAMLSSAVEATVHVSLAATTATHVHGKIFAHIPWFGDEDHVILFGRGADERVELAPSSDGGSIIPLARSVVVMPIDSSLEIKVNLHVTTTIAHVHEDATVAFGGDLVFSLGEHMLQIHTAIGKLSVHVDVTQ